MHLEVAATPLPRRRPPSSRRRPPGARRPDERSPTREHARLRSHFREVLAELRARDVAALAPGPRAARAAMIAELARYAAAGEFPLNLDFPGRRVPYFVDAAGTPCAMAHLIATSGRADLVARIAGAANHALIRELAGDAELVA